MKTARIAQRIWPLTTGKLADLVWDTTIELRYCSRKCTTPRHRKLRRRLAVAYHAMRLYRRCEA